MSTNINNKGAISAGHKLTAEAGAEILRDGGNAYDAMVAALLASTVVEPVFSSLGGGGCLMAHAANSETSILYDFFVSAPNNKRSEADLDFHAIHAEFGPARQEFHIGYGATAIPGFVPGLFAIHRDLCSLPMSRLAEPAIRTAREGVVLTKFQAYLFTVVTPILTNLDQAARYFAPHGHLLVEGEIYRNPELADTIDALAREGESFFTQGTAAKAIAEDSQNFGGHLTLEDLSSYQVIKREPVNGQYKKAEVALNPSPAASGPLIGFGLGFLEALTGDASPSVTQLAETMHATNKIREGWTGDLSKLADQSVIAREIAALENLMSAPRGTTHISVIDAQGNAASATVTNGEGNGHMVGDLGFMMNNMLGEEDLNPSGFHNWTPGERLSTMMAPTLVSTDEGTVTALGSGGSNRIRTAVLQVIMNLIDHQTNLQTAIDAPRMHWEKCGTLSFEDVFSQEDQAAIFALQAEAKAWPGRNFFFGGVNAVSRRQDGTFDCYADPRRDGAALIV